MMPARSDTDDSLPTIKDDLSRPGSNGSSPVLVRPNAYDRQPSNPIMTALSPPPPQGFKHSKPRPPQSHLRLRSDSGLALHSNQAGSRQYTHYNPDSPADSRPSPARTSSNDGTSSVEDSYSSRRLSPKLRGFAVDGRVLPDFFEPAVIKIAFSDETTVRKLRTFAETRHGGSDVDFLLKVGSRIPLQQDLIPHTNPPPQGR
ncbi:hypothetical protein VTG60DRAFT_3155 [Thermothelomyces hinnuleus]